MSVQEMMKRFEKTGLSDVSAGSTPVSAPPSASRPRSQVARRTASYRTAAPPPRLRHRNSEGRLGLTRSRPVSTHISPLLRERPAVLKRNAALKARVSDRVRDMDRRPSAETAPEAEDKGDVKGSPSPPMVVKAGQQNSDVTVSRAVHRLLTRVIPTDAASPRPLTAPAGNHVGSPAGSPGVSHTNSSTGHQNGSADIDNNNRPAKPGRLKRQAASAVPLPAIDDFSSLPLPDGPPPRKPPRTFAHDVYAQARRSAGAATTVAIRRSSSGPRPAVARKPSDLGRRSSGRLETFQPRPAAGASAGRSPAEGVTSPVEHVYAEPAVSRRDLPPPPPSPPPPPPPGRDRRPTRGPVEPYAVSQPLRRTASDETLYGTLSREHVYERLSEAKTRPVSISNSATGSPPGLRRNPAFKRHERPSLRHAGPARPPPPSLARAQRRTESRMGCLLTSISGDLTADADDAERSERWKAGPLALRRKNYLRRVSTQMGGSRPRVTTSPRERLFDALLVVALSADAEGMLEPCVVSRYPPDVSLEADVSPFCFPDAARWQRAPDVWGRSSVDGGAAYTVVVTDERGGRSFGFCRRLTADTGGDAVTLPIAYCLLTRHDAPAFYSKLLSALLEHHGTAEQHRLSVLDQLHAQPFPLPGGSVSVPRVPAACLGEQPELPATNGTPATDAQSVLVRRSLDSRLEEDGLYLLVRRLGVDLFIKLLGSALLERKIVLYSAHLGMLSAAVSALQAALCPFVWQHCLVPVVPSRLAELLAVPSPFIMGALPETRPLEHLNDQEDVICVDLDTPSLVQSVGDEATILPRRLCRTLSEALKLAACLPGGEPAPGVASVMLGETLLRLFVEVCGHYRSHLVTQQDGRPMLQREAFVEAAPTDDVREFLEWFTETAMFNAFIEVCDLQPESPTVSLFDRRVMEQHGDMDTSCHGLLHGTKQLGKALGGRFKFR